MWRCAVSAFLVVVSQTCGVVLLSAFLAVVLQKCGLCCVCFPSVMQCCAACLNSLLDFTRCACLNRLLDFTRCACLNRLLGFTRCGLPAGGGGLPGRWLLQAQVPGSRNHCQGALRPLLQERAGMACRLCYTTCGLQSLMSCVYMSDQPRCFIDIVSYRFISLSHCWSMATVHCCSKVESAMIASALKE